MPKPETEFTHLSDDALSRIGFFLSDTDRGRLASVNRQSFAVLGFSGYVKRVFGIDLSTFPLQALFFDASMVSERPEQLQLLRVLSLQEDYWQYAIVSE
ncbi:hypothetical protein [Legionella oakridgensis]|uniref:Uncharacterized protein n=2 Tax=Legionella oakridgensis TaxID=29423 RepID=W0BHB1_9GAMM|nr:hypothetical protein [Legionella oakridgensis]AHE67784.1 hypothetical protein Loa_02242 [Legionella oakridgensis ATCC 33761 = DSM 21215]ETO92684.1 hypothetical protein LOR_34c02740 [Legionella oakridgensis RV-2-2007]KTD36892.1 hypothetical protein Loak_2028 [Legionella oakridgensis]STY20799.1 Uncharacterised protein [Legionella longbeachae]